jgi:predicted RNA-binding protein YlxR (DUF448 family)
VACRTSRQKRELVRIVRSPDGRIDIDETGRAPGRGAYLCADGGCWDQALASNALGRALATPVPDALRVRLEAEATERRTGSLDASMAPTTTKEM